MNGTSYTLLNGIDIDALRQSMASAFIPNYSAKQVFYLPHGIVQDVSPLVKSAHQYFPTCRISCNCNAFMVLGDGYRLNNSSCGGVARKCTDASDVNNAAMLIDPWRPIEDDYYGGYFIPKGKYIYVKGPAWRNGDNSRKVTICPLGLTTTDWSYTCDIYCNRGASFGWQHSADLGNTWISQTPPNEWFAGN